MTTTPASIHRMSGQGSDPMAVRALINAILDVLGSTKRGFWPFWEATGSAVIGIAPTDLTSRDEAASRALESEWLPKALRATGLYAYRNPAAAGNNHFTAGDHADYSHGNGTVDTAFSIGMWVAPRDIATVALMSKYDVAGTAREFAFRINSAGKLALELYDESATASEIATAEDVLTADKMVFVVVTYDGTETAPVILFYVDGVHDGGDGTSVETGSYVAMEGTAAALTLMANGPITAPTEMAEGWVALPFITGKALTAAEVAELYQLTRPLVGA